MADIAASVLAKLKNKWPKQSAMLTTILPRRISAQA